MTWQMDATGLTREENAKAFRLLCVFNEYDRALEQVREAREKALAMILESAAEIDRLDREAEQAFDAVCAAEDESPDRARDAVRRFGGTA